MLLIIGVVTLDGAIDDIALVVAALDALPPEHPGHGCLAQKLILVLLLHDHLLRVPVPLVLSE